MFGFFFFFLLRALEGIRTLAQNTGAEDTIYWVGRPDKNACGCRKGSSLLQAHNLPPNSSFWGGYFTVLSSPLDSPREASYNSLYRLLIFFKSLIIFLLTISFYSFFFFLGYLLLFLLCFGIWWAHMFLAF